MMNQTNPTMQRRHFCRLTVFWGVSAFTFSANAWEAGPVLKVGPGKDFERIEDAVQAAVPGTEIIVYPRKGREPYTQVHILVRTPKLTIRSADPKHPIVLDGAGFDYSGAGSIPRAIVQFNAGADGGKLVGFILQNAHNQTHNAAGVRISQANGVTVSRCIIRSNDMGVMSDGSAVQKTGTDQRIERCRIVRNGALEDAGFNHNLYLGGNSAVVSRCDIGWSLTGHNLKSRVHQLTVSDCFIHDAANRELDLVDSKENTDQPNSSTLLLGNRIVKDPNCQGNKNVIHFGTDQGVLHDGVLTLRKNFIETPFSSPVIDLSDGKGLVLQKNRFSDAGSGSRAPLVQQRTKIDIPIRGSENQFPKNFILPAFGQIPQDLQRGK